MVVGTFAGTVTIGTNTFTSYGDKDIFVAKCGQITGIGEKKMTTSDRLMIYANPNDGKCTIIIPDDFINEQNLTLTIFDSKGRTIQTDPVELDGNKTRINIQAEASGMYNIILTNRKKSYSGKIVFK